ncbi:flagellar basal body L-ring protein FlgH [Chromobacterium violaceum]|uniref:Flagellar L-ring protein 2 n=2 Tax=Chromobacterium violaceum TaxID=536 RepID=FLGH2_CHRVO|nr:flagellar basal body L-ring protein FlgH [Chromobacterium violaceum]Q7NU21.1 RecName: Full=Flagellar L-ring protein 2; AltName: Full=Basal body L-ring protein 2; Flags: Precursor [Chromobacterium violaceum ATCC 12472]AAQ60550.1 flagellar L-ring protein precursor flgH [Chromobacterium violaceum ATCC 12472]ATP29247.1 flagellar L-ring protein [Chromobacterium violaceum]ATP33154.1 flagellar L-ring protein [Chromobacterium violaceum]KJH68414.1 flagellar L-ring protein FlgH [Chromobacterium viola
MKSKLAITMVSALLLAACAVQEPPLVQGPTTAKPQPRPVGLPANGAIFQAASYRPMFQDAMPIQVGDTLQITIQENSSTSQSEQVTDTRTSGLSSNITAGVKIPFLPSGLASGLGGTSFNSSGSANNTGKGNNQVATTFVSSITVTVTDVLANGNLVVSGEKMVRINSDTESIRLSGVVNPRDVTPDRTVSSLKVADARIEQQTKGNNRLYNEPGWLSKIFMSLLPI